jgi:hypothetical protein
LKFAESVSEESVSLTSLIKNWVTYDNDIMEALFGAVTSLNDEGFSACKVTADTKTDPTMTLPRCEKCLEKKAKRK